MTDDKDASSATKPHLVGSAAAAERVADYTLRNQDTVRVCTLELLLGYR